MLRRAVFYQYVVGLVNAIALAGTNVFFWYFMYNQYMSIPGKLGRSPTTFDRLRVIYPPGN